MSAFQVGDVVECIAPGWSGKTVNVGRQGTVSAVGVQFRQMPEGLERADGIVVVGLVTNATSFRADGTLKAVRPERFRKVNPPDWQAPLGIEERVGV